MRKRFQVKAVRVFSSRFHNIPVLAQTNTTKQDKARAALEAMFSN